MKLTMGHQPVRFVGGVCAGRREGAYVRESRFTEERARDLVSAGSLDAGRGGQRANHFGLWPEWLDAAVVSRQSKSFAIRRHGDSHDFLRNVTGILIHG